LLKGSKDRIIAAKLITLPQKRFAAELIGTFMVVVLATGSVLINAKLGGKLGLLPFIAFAPFVGVPIDLYLFGKILIKLSGDTITECNTN
jgi:hypothetical protein